MTTRLVFSLVAAGLGACGGAIDFTGGDDTPGDDSPGDDTPGDDGPGTPDAGPGEPPPLCTTTGGRIYANFDGTDLAAERVPALAGLDRLRVKPLSALGPEYARVLGNNAAKVNPFAATFGRPPARWSIEPELGSDALFAAYTIAYQGCLAFTRNPAVYAAAPTAESARPVCTELATRFWDREPDAFQVDACVDLATQGTATEIEPRRRWALTCAAVLTSAGFLTY